MSFYLFKTIKIEDFMNKLLQSYVTFILVKPDLLVPQYSIEPFIEKIKKLWEKSYEFFKKIKIDSQAEDNRNWNKEREKRKKSLFRE